MSIAYWLLTGATKEWILKAIKKYFKKQGQPGFVLNLGFWGHQYNFNLNFNFDIILITKLVIFVSDFNYPTHFQSCWHVAIKNLILATFSKRWDGEIWRKRDLKFDFLKGRELALLLLYFLLLTVLCAWHCTKVGLVNPYHNPSDHCLPVQLYSETTDRTVVKLDGRVQLCSANNKFKFY